MEQIKSRLAGLRLPGMAHCWQTLYETRKVNELSLSDGLELLLQSEEDQRTSNRCARLLKNAAFRYKASIEELSNDPARGIDKSLITRLSLGEYIKKRRLYPYHRSGRCRKKLPCIRPGSPSLFARLLGGVLQHAETDDQTQTKPAGGYHNPAV